MKKLISSVLKINPTVLLLTSCLMIPFNAHSVALIDGLGGPAGFGELAMNPNDDGSSSQLLLPFDINFFGDTHSSFFINNNGNITFNGSVSGYTPVPFPVASQPMIAPFWGDVDTSCSTCGAVYVDSPNAETTVVTWNNVGFFPSDSSLTNNFQLILRDQSGVAGNSAGDFDIEFRYDQLNWTTGDASGGLDGLGGTEAQAGFDAGNGTDFFVLPGSLTPQVLDLANTTNVAGGENGLWSFAIRAGSTPGQTPDNPLLPVVVDDSFTFEFGVDLDERIFIDPDVAIGYEYAVTSGPSMTAVTLPTGFGDDLYDLQLFDGTNWVFDSVLTGGVEHFFSSPLDQFRILGIEEILAVDPTDPLAFVTGLRFESAGVVSMSQTPLTTFVADSSGVPEPSTLFLLASGLIGFGFAKKRKAVKK